MSEVKANTEVCFMTFCIFCDLILDGSGAAGCNSCERKGKGKDETTPTGTWLDCF